MTTPAPLSASARWVASFIGFPVGGLAAHLLVGPVDGPTAALAGGLLTGMVLGAAQALALRWSVRPRLGWIAVSTAGMALGLLGGAELVGYATDPTSLAVQGAVSGGVVGLAQATVLRSTLGRVALVWPALLAGCWALGWTVTAAVGVRVDEGFTVFGSSGALTVSLLTTVLAVALVRQNTSRSGS